MLDSVVGAFLTQNVTDALSSKAFMTMVATFPPTPGGFYLHMLPIFLIASVMLAPELPLEFHESGTEIDSADCSCFKWTSRVFNKIIPSKGLSQEDSKGGKVALRAMLLLWSGWTASIGRMS